MPASNERIMNKALSGREVAAIIRKRVEEILAKDGMYSSNIAYSRVAFNIRVSLQANIAGLPEHITEIHSIAGSKTEVKNNPSMEALGVMPLELPADPEDEAISSTEIKEQIQSPNVARIEHGMPIPTGKMDPETGTERSITYTGDMPDPVAVGNKLEVTDTSEDQTFKIRAAQAKKKAGGSR